MVLNDRFIEITGASCSGKSHFLESRGKDPLKAPIYLVPVGFFLAALVSIRGVILLCFWCIRSDRSWWHIFRVSGHVFAKFGYPVCISRGMTGAAAVVDEGISHIPFILMLSSEETELFLKLFGKSLAGVSIIFLTVDLHVMRSRMKARGHKRVRSETDLKRFCFYHHRIQEYYPELLKGAGLKVETFSG